MLKLKEERTQIQEYQLSGRVIITATVSVVHLAA